jgi:hypothetical protein
MRSHLLVLFTATLSSGCGFVTAQLGEPVERDCDTRLPYYPDDDGDGVGAMSPVYLGCEAPSGYVETTGDCDDSDPAVIECADTDPPDDTGPRDTAPPDDTGPQDTASDPTDTDSPAQG